MKPGTPTSRARRRLIQAVLLLCAWCWLIVAWASPPPAGTVIRSAATATFVDAASGLSVHLQSNTLLVNIVLVEACTLSPGQNVLRAPGSDFSLPHTVTNAGNADETCLFDLASASGSGFTPQSLRVVEDLNGNGVADSGEPVLDASHGIALAPGASASVLVTGQVPATATQGQSVTLRLDAVSSVQQQKGSSTDTVTAISGAVLSVTKSASTAAPVPGGTVTYTISATNVGNMPAAGGGVTVDGAAQSLVLLRDAIPANTTYRSLGQVGPAELLFHRFGDGPTTYLSAPPAGVPVDGVAWGVPSLAPGASLSGQFTVTVNANAAGTLANTAYVDYQGVGGATETPSNLVQLPLPDNPAQISFYPNGGYANPVSVSPLDSPLFVQINAAACNTDPGKVLSYPVRLGSQLTHDVETFTAVETAANTGIFRIQPNVPTADARTHAVVTGDGVLGLLPNDVVTAMLLGCSGAGSVNATLLIDPLGVVFDSKSNQPVAGATVTLVDASGAPAKVYQPDGATIAPNSVVTGEDGTFSFPLVAAGSYRLQVAPPTGYRFPSKLPPALLPTGRVIDANGSYGNSFALAGKEPVRIDIPLDAAATGGLVVQKSASKSSVEVGDFIDYSVTVTNHSGLRLDDIVLSDWLPAGFEYMKGSARLQGTAIPDPRRAAGVMGFALGSLVNDGQAVLTYRVAVTPGAQSGNGVNSAQAQSGTLRSNMASVKVDLVGGVFTDKAVLIGKVYADCNGNRVQDPGEPGLPGVRVWLADGTYAVTDVDGKYGLYALTPRTTVAAVDPATLPQGTALESLSHRNAFDPSSQFVDLQNGELHKADFAIRECGAAVRAEIAARRRALDQSGEIVQAMQSLPSVLQTTTLDQRALPASGTIGPNGAMANGSVAPTGLDPLAMNSFGTIASGVMPLGAVGDTGGPVTEHSPAARPLFPSMPAAPAAGEQGAKAPAAAQPAVVPLSAQLASLDGKVGFVNLKDGQVMPTDQARVQVKGPAGATLQLSVNGKDIPASQVGMRATLASRGVTGWDYIGVNLRPGRNALTVTAVDPFGNKRGSAGITVLAPGQLAALHVILPKTALADSQTPAMITVEPVDANGLPVTTRLPLTLTSSSGTWQGTDLKPDEPGQQVFVEGGRGSYPLLPPAIPGTADITVTAGSVEGDAKLVFSPNLRPLFGVGMVEGVLNLSKLDPHAIVPTQSTDAFEAEMGSISRNFDGGKARATARSQVFLKGKVLGSTLLTLGYDSAKPSDTELFRDIQPDRYYPVYGDSSVKGFDAQSTGKLYVRLDHGTSYVLLGDYSTQSDNPARQLTQYTRALNGLKGHGQAGGLVVDGFASHTSSNQVVVEMQGNGTSGPYQLNLNGVINSQQVDLITRDRNQPGVVLADKPMTPFVDYTIENLTGRLLFMAPVPAVDANLNPVFIRVTYEVDTGGPKHWVGGASAQYQLTQRLNVGGTVIQDNNPADRQKLDGLNATMQLGKSMLVAEVAQSDTDEHGQGGAQRLEWRAQGSALQGRVWGIHTDASFYNPSALQSAGQSQYGVQMGYRLSPQDRIAVEGLRSISPLSGGTQTGVSASLQHTLPGSMKLSVGVRHASGEAQTTAPSSGGEALPGSVPVDFVSTFARLDAPVPHVPAANVYTQYERALNESAQVVSLGGSYALGNAGKLYLTHETNNSLSGAYGLNPNVNQYSTVLGFQSALPDRTQVFNEYRIGGGMDARGAEDAVGLRHLWRIAPGLGLSASAERIHPVSGKVSDASSALTTAASYTASDTWKASGRVEWREAQNSRSWLVTGAVATKLDESWTLLNRGLYNALDNTGADAGSQHLAQFQSGFAYRPVDSDVWNALGMIGYKRDQDTTLPVGQQVNERSWMMLAQVNVQPSASWDMSARYAAKHAVDEANGLVTVGWTQLIGGRVIHDIGQRWDVGAQAYTSWGFGTRRDAIGMELGYLVRRNLWLSLGYNVLGFSDPDLAGGEYTQHGIYLRLRFKFGADLFDSLGGMHALPGGRANAAAALESGIVQGGDDGHGP